MPDSEMRISISEVLETLVSTLLGETVDLPEVDDLKAVSEKLEMINMQFAKGKEARRKTLHWLFISLDVIIIIIYAALIKWDSPYLG